MDVETDASFRCPNCANEVTANVLMDEPIWGGENPATPEMQVVRVTCPSCESAFGTRVWVTPSLCSLEFIDHPETVITATHPMVRDAHDDWDDWDDYEIPADPFAVLNASLTDASVLLDEIGGTRGLLNRLVFANFITSFEVFLSDTLINRVLGSEHALKRLIARDKQLSDMRFSLSAIATAPNLIRETVRSRLRREMWHNIKSASALYNKAFEIDILELFADDTAKILKAVDYRHDCVHRNGRDKDGNELDVLTREYIEDIAKLLHQIASAIDHKFRDRDAEAFFGPPEPGKQ
ncbi:hypothetical protein BH10PSE6_BH10PSE6_08100 [soil metagenome]